MGIMEKIPERFSMKWLLIWLVTSLASLVVMTVTLGIAVLMGAEVGGAVIVTYMTVLFLNIIVCLIGFFGGRYWFAISEMGLLAAGSVGTSVALVDYAGWEALVVVYALIFIGLVTGLLGLLVQIISRVRRDKEPLSPITAKVLWIIYVLSLLTLMLSALFGMDYGEKVRGNEEGLEGQLTSAVYSGGTAEYGFEITVTEDKVTSERYDIETTSGERQKVNVQTTARTLKADEMYELEQYILQETDFLNEEDDLSTEDSITDAEGAMIRLDFGVMYFEKGGYYPYDNLSFKRISDYISLMSTGETAQEMTPYEKLIALDHPDEKAIQQILMDTVTQLETIEKDALYIVPTYGAWTFDNDTMVYAIEVELEADYGKKTAFIYGELSYDLENDTFSFHKKSSGEFTGNLLKNIGLSNAAKRLEGMNR